MNIVSTEKAPAAIGPYSQAIEIDGLLFLSGQIPINPETGTAPEGIKAQAQQSCRNIEAILKATGLSFDNVIKTTCFLSDMADFQLFNEIYSKFFISKPARSCVAVKSIPKGLLCEIEVIAKK